MQRQIIVINAYDLPRLLTGSGKSGNLKYSSPEPGKSGNFNKSQGKINVQSPWKKYKNIYGEW